MNKLELQKTANEICKGIVSGVHAAKRHASGRDSVCSRYLTHLYFEEMNDPKNPKDPDRDRFVLSKGHTAPGLYAALAEKGYFPKEDLLTPSSPWLYPQGHPDMKHIPALICRAVPSDRESPQQSEWHSLQNCRTKHFVFIHFWAMVKSRKVRSGRQPCLPEQNIWTTSLRS